MWKVGSKWKLEKEDYKEIQNRIQQGEHPADVAADFKIAEFEARKISGTLEA